MAKSDTAERILDIAEKAARTGGYNAFSFREIAAEIGIKSASVHYHFPTKEALGEALAKRYSDHFFSVLGDPQGAEPAELLKRYVAAYGAALKQDGLMCLCGVFGAEIADLPPPVASATRAFFERNLEWLQQVHNRQGLAPDAAEQAAAHMIAALEGAMILARAMGNAALFDAAVAGLS
ncbi:MAG: TetR/AcrR family transcriptional regulator [Rhodobacteraceae bacterium]|nr:TetR/AcrR family transcriptional regulator [Paracoccaceae bacterium]